MSTQSDLVGKLEADVEIKSDVEKFFKILFDDTHLHVPSANPSKVQKIDHHGGDFEKDGAVRQWNYTIDGKAETINEKVVIDKTKRTMTVTALEGDVLELYKTYKLTLYFIPKGKSGTMKVTIDYEKKDEATPPPQKYLDWIISVAEDISAHLDKHCGDL